MPASGDEGSTVTTGFYLHGGPAASTIWWIRHARTGRTGLIGFPLALLAWHAWRSRRTTARIRVSGPVAHVAKIGIFLALYLTPDYAPAPSVTSDAALLFYGPSMLIAALRGYAGCEVFAVSNWILGRDDQVGCLAFAPVDRMEHGPR